MKHLNKLFTFIFALVSSGIFANCNFQLNSPIINLTASNVNVNTSEDLNISRPTNSSLIHCSLYYYYFSKGSSSSYSRKAMNNFGEGINYNLYKNSNQTGILKDLNDASGVSEFLAGFLLLPNITSSRSFYFNLPSFGAGSMKRGGTYTDNVLVNIYSIGTPGNIKNFEFSRNIPIVINVPKIINISLVESGGPFDMNSTNKTLNFGELESGEEMNFDMRVATNSGYRVSFSSLNNGKLGSQNTSNKINYNLLVSGNNINLLNSASNPVLVAQGSGVTSSEGSVFPVKVKIGSVTDSQFGNYEDYITITTVTND